jgi:uncharacterized paraquat-inducible protein A
MDEPKREPPRLDYATPQPKVKKPPGAKLVACEACGTQVAENAPLCPVCGHRRYAKPSILMVVARWIFGLLALLSLILGMTGGTRDSVVNGVVTAAFFGVFCLLTFVRRPVG